MPKNKKQKEYSSSYEKKISINPMTDAFSMEEDKAPIAGAIGRARVGEFTPTGRAISTMKKNPKTSSGVAGALGGTGAGYAAGRYDGENLKTSDRLTENDIKFAEEAVSGLAEESTSGMKKGGMVVARGSRLVKVKPTKLY
jgi:hypothetical protein